MSKIALGTAQFGFDYGINNKTGKITELDAARILAEAVNSGIDFVDTAADYGSSEEVIGNISSGRYKFKVVTKLSGIPCGKLKEKLRESLVRLHTEKVYACLFHSFTDYSAHASLWGEMSACRSEGLSGKIGFSLYYPAEAETLLAAGVEPDILQIPFNILDQRFARLLPEFKKKNIEIHVRSVFLQGLLLKEISELSGFFYEARPILDHLRQIAERAGVSMQSLCLNFAAQNSMIDKVVVGIDNLDQLRINVLNAAQGGALAGMLGELQDIKFSNEDILIPSRWR